MTLRHRIAAVLAVATLAIAGVTWGAHEQMERAVGRAHTTVVDCRRTCERCAAVLDSLLPDSLVPAPERTP